MVRVRGWGQGLSGPTNFAINAGCSGPLDKKALELFKGVKASFMGDLHIASLSNEQLALLKPNMGDSNSEKSSISSEVKSLNEFEAELAAASKRNRKKTSKDFKI